MKLQSAKRWVVIVCILGLPLTLVQAAFVRDEFSAPDSILAGGFRGGAGGRWVGIQPLYSTTQTLSQKAGGRRLLAFRGHAVGFTGLWPQDTLGFYSIYPGAGFSLQSSGGATLDLYPDLLYGKQVDFSRFWRGVNWNRNAIQLRPEDLVNASLIRAYFLWGRGHGGRFWSPGPKDGGSVPAVPEPATFYAALLMLVPLSGSAWRLWRQRRAS